MKNAALISCFYVAAAVLVPAWAFAATPAMHPYTKGPKDIPALREAVGDCKNDPTDSWMKDGGSAVLQGIRLEALNNSEAGAMLQACVGLEQPDGCDSLHLGSEAQNSCHRFKAIFPLLRGLFKGSAFQATCVRYMESQGRGKSLDPEVKARTCKRVAEVLRDPRQYDSFCEKIMPILGGNPSAQALKNCKARTLALKGQPKLCDQAGLGYCRVMAGAVATLHFNQPGTCSAQPLCSEAVSGKAPMCTSYRAALNKEYCSVVATALADLELEPGEMKHLAAEEAKTKQAQQAQKDAVSAKASAAHLAALAAAQAQTDADLKQVKDKAAKMAVAQAAAAATVKAKADAEAKKAAAAKIAKPNKPQFQKGQPMRTTPAEAPSGTKPKPKKVVKEDEATDEAPAK